MNTNTTSNSTTNSNSMEVKLMNTKINTLNKLVAKFYEEHNLARATFYQIQLLKIMFTHDKDSANKVRKLVVDIMTNMILITYKDLLENFPITESNSTMDEILKKFDRDDMIGMRNMSFYPNPSIQYVYKTIPEVEKLLNS